MNTTDVSLRILTLKGVCLHNFLIQYDQHAGTYVLSDSEDTKFVPIRGAKRELRDTLNRLIAEGR